MTYDGSRVAAGIKVYLDGRLAPLDVLLDELNQSFQSKEPLRIGAGGGLENRFVGGIDEVQRPRHRPWLTMRSRFWPRVSRSGRSWRFPSRGGRLVRHEKSETASWRPERPSQSAS